MRKLTTDESVVPGFIVWGVRREVKHLSTYRKRYSVSSGERKRRRLNHARVILVRGCVCGVVGCSRISSDRLVRK